MTKYDIKRVPRELLEEYVLNHTLILSPVVGGMTAAESIREAAKIPLRTKAEVNTDIVELVRLYVKDHPGVIKLRFDSEYAGKPACERLVELAEEETSD